MNWPAQQTLYQSVIPTCKDERERGMEVSEIDDSGREERRRRKSTLERAAESISVRRK